MSSEESETRTRVLEAAVRLLEARRGQSVRMGDIAKTAGISRQAVYLHFASRTDLLVAATRFLDEKLDVDSRLAPSRAATSGIERLRLYIECWGNYIPEIYGIAKALLAMRDTDDAAAEAWDQRMRDVREGCEAAIDALAADNMLSPDLPPNQATDLLWTMLSVRNWEQLTIGCGWPQARYIATLKSMARRIFVSD